MRKFLFLSSVFAVAAVCVFAFWNPLTRTIAQFDNPFVEKEPDIVAMLKDAKNSIPKEEFLQARAEFFGTLRGVHKDLPVDPQLRQIAVNKMDEQIETLSKSPNENVKDLVGASWTPIGPAPIPNGAFPWSGRTISIDIHPTNPDIVYVGTAQGGLYRSTDGGTNWTPLMDGAQSLAIGAIAISPTNPETVYIGTGEHNFSADSFFGVGVYRIENASTTANLVGPLNKDSVGNDIFTGRGISRIIVHPTDSNTIFVSTTSGVGGIIGTNIAFPSRGVYRSTNANSANPTFAKLTGLNSNNNNSVRDIAIDPNNPNILLAGVVTTAGSGGGIYRSVNALAANPTFTQVQAYAGGSTSELTTEFAAIHPTGDTNATFYAATGNGGGRVLRSTDGGQTWTQQIDNNFCTPQCFYDIGIAVDPTNVDNVYVGGSPAQVFGISTNGGVNFTNSSGGVHVDSHVIAVSQSNPSTIYFGTDGGIYKSTNSGGTWQSLNNTQFFATQFMSVAVHPSDANFSIGGTQDNGTNYYDPAGNWTRVRGGDGGYAVIDQNAPDTTNVRMYHTFFNRINSVVGYETRPTTSSGWTFRGCGNGVTPANGINCNDTAIRFYAPLERGPGNPNTIYYGSDRLYRSDDTGLNHTVVSQAPITSGVALTAIGISDQNDDVRIVGLQNGQIMGTSTGSSTLADLDSGNAVPNLPVARTVVDPNNQTTAYVTLSTFNVNSVYKTTNLNAANPTWTNASGSGGTAIPQIPVSAFVVDPNNSNTLYAGTDIGVYVSSDAGTSWMPFGSNLPRVAVFDMAITGSTPRKLRVATHGKGMYDIVIDPVAPTDPVFDFDGDGKTDVSIFRPTENPAQWWLLRSSDAGNSAFSFGLPTDTPTPADFTGDGKTDIAFFRESTSEWFVLRSEDNSFFSFPFGAAGDIPAPGDYDGDGKADAAVFRPSTATWFINRSSDMNIDTIGFGIAEDKPTIADFDGDGRDDIAIYRPSNGQWWQLRSTDGVIAYAFGQTGDQTVPGDYTGDGKADVALFRPSSSEWFVLRSEDSSFFSFPFGASGDIPVPGDYDGDGSFDAAVFRPSNTTWFLNGSTSGTQIVGFGFTNDVPLANSFVND